MNAINHYHDQIARATERLAKLQARALLSHQRQESKLKVAAKREQARRRQRIGTIVDLAGADNLDDAELAACLQNYLESKSAPSVRDAPVDRGNNLPGGPTP